MVLVLVIAVAAAAFLLVAPAREVATAANRAILGVLRGDVDAQRGEGAFEPAIDGELLASGDVVRSNAQGRAVLTFFEGSTLSVEPGAQVRVISHARTAGNALQVVIEQLSGRTWASVQQLASPDSRFEIRTPSLTATVRGTAFETIIEVVNGQPVTTIKTTEGEVLVRAQGGGGDTTVGPDQQVTVPVGAPAPAVQPQPPTPRLQFQGTAGLGYLVVDPHGRTCGSTGNTLVRQIPRCDVQGGRVTVGEVVAGEYSIVATAAQAAPDAQIAVQGLRGQTRDFGVAFATAMNVGDLVRTTLPVTVAADGRLGGGPFARAEVVTSVCGAEATGTVFSSGKIGERFAALEGFAQQQKDQPVALVITQSDLEVEAREGIGMLGADSPATVSDPSVRIDRAGLRLSATASAGPLAVPLKVDVIAGARNGKLILRVRSVDVGAVPGPVADQIRAAVEQQFNSFAESFTFEVERVALRDGCMAVIGRTAP